MVSDTERQSGYKKKEKKHIGNQETTGYITYPNFSILK